MAKIIYKNGQEGQNCLECIEGIEIDLFNGQKALIYPKYSEEIMLPKDKIISWNANEINEIDAFKKEDNKWETEVLFKYGSPAAKYASNFHSREYGVFRLPTLLAAMEIHYHMNEIDALAKTINEADLLYKLCSNIWSCFRSNKNGCWAVWSGSHSISRDYLYNSNVIVPTILYKYIRHF